MSTNFVAVAKAEVVGCVSMAAIPKRRTADAQNVFDALMKFMVLLPSISVALLTVLRQQLPLKSALRTTSGRTECRMIQQGQ